MSLLRFLLVYAIVTGLVAAAGVAQAQQYRSEMRVLEDVPDDRPPPDVEKLLERTTDPYERALLLRDLAARAARDGEHEQAARHLDEAISLGALSSQAQRAMEQDLSRLLVASGDPDAIINALEPRVREGRDVSAAQQAALGSAYAAKRRYREARPLLERAIARSEQPEENWLRALLATQMGLERYGDASNTVTQLLRRNPRESDYWHQAIALNLRAGRERDAQAAMEVAARLGFVRDAEDRRRLAALTARIGAPHVAATQMQEWMEREQVPRNQTTLRELSRYWLAARESGEAARSIEAVLEFGTDIPLLLQLGQEYMDQERYTQAVRAFERVVAQQPGNGSAQMALAVSRYQVADVDGAITAFRAAAETGTQEQLARRWIDYLESGRAREQAMAAAAERAQRRRDPDRALASAVLGERIDLAANGDDEHAASPRRPGGALTPVGAEAGPSSDGVIPAWDGGITPDRWPAGFARGERLVDPFVTDKPVAEITAENMGRYAQYLSDGHKALLRRHDSYRMPLYPTRRSVSYPRRIYEATRENDGRARLIGSDGLVDARLGFPFPRPESGVEVMWNHRVRYRGDSVMLRSEQAVVQARGRIDQELYQTERVYFRYGNLEDPSDIARNNILLYYLTWFSRDPSGVNFLALAHETANSAEGRRAVWVMPPRANRLFRVPPVGYDQPFPGSDAIYFVDMLDMYNGAFDRYVWRLVGKRELIVPYNNFKLVDGSVERESLLRPKHPNPDALRYERHRVWVVEATQREGTSHTFGKRVFYVDEDSWNVVLVENYDNDDRLWRVQEGHLLPLYDVQAANAMPVVTYDLRDDRYFINRMIDRTDPPQYDVPGIRAGDFLPSAVRARYVR